MNTIYVDFEALSNPVTIVSIGAIDSKGREFYRLIRPFSFNFDSGRNTMLLELTGLNEEELKKAQNVNQVFGAFSTWVNTVEKDNKFVFYGDADSSFLLKTLKECGERGQALAPQVIGIISNMLLNYRDASSEVAYLKGKTNMLGQTACIEALGGKLEGEAHNALDDARNLKLLCSLCLKTGNKERLFESMLIKDGGDTSILSSSYEGNSVKREKCIAHLNKRLYKSLGLK